MLDLRAARDRAVWRAVETGDMANMDLIHARQEKDGFIPCFGRSEAVCSQSHCSFHTECAALASFQPKPVTMPVTIVRTPAPSITRAKIGGYRDGKVSTSSKTVPPVAPKRRTPPRRLVEPEPAPAGD